MCKNFQKFFEKFWHPWSGGAYVGRFSIFPSKLPTAGWRKSRIRACLIPGTFCPSTIYIAKSVILWTWKVKFFKKFAFLYPLTAYRTSAWSIGVVVRTNEWRLCTLHWAGPASRIHCHLSARYGARVFRIPSAALPLFIPISISSAPPPFPQSPQHPRRKLILFNLSSIVYLLHGNSLLIRH